MATETERPLPKAALSNPYSMLSREELDAAFGEVKQQLAVLSAEEPRWSKLEKKRRQISQGYMWLMVRQGLADWDGGKPKGSKHPLKLGPGQLIGDMVHEMRR